MRLARPVVFGALCAVVPACGSSSGTSTLSASESRTVARANVAIASHCVAMTGTGTASASQIAAAADGLDRLISVARRDPDAMYGPGENAQGRTSREVLSDAASLLDAGCDPTLARRADRALATLPGAKGAAIVTPPPEAPPSAPTTSAPSPRPKPAPQEPPRRLDARLLALHLSDLPAGFAQRGREPHRTITLTSFANTEAGQFGIRTLLSTAQVLSTAARAERRARALIQNSLVGRERVSIGQPLGDEYALLRKTPSAATEMPWYVYILIWRWRNAVLTLSISGPDDVPAADVAAIGEAQQERIEQSSR